MGANVEELLRSNLKEWGFRKRGGSYYRTTGAGLYMVVAIQNSAWGDSKYLNFGYADSSLAVSGWLPENRCQLRFRLNAVTGVTDEMLTLFESGGGEGSPSAVDGLFELIRPLLMIESWQDVRSFVGDRVSATRIFVHRDVRAFMSAGQEGP